MTTARRKVGVCPECKEQILMGSKLAVMTHMDYCLHASWQEGLRILAADIKMLGERERRIRQLMELSGG